MYSNNFCIIVGFISMVLFCSFGEINCCSGGGGGGGNDDHENDHTGCPTVDSVAPMNSNYTRFWCFNAWQLWGDSLMVGGCNGDTKNGYDGKRDNGTEGRMVPIGSLMVLAGCTFYGFEWQDFEGDVITYDGPRVYPDACVNGKCPKREAKEEEYANGFGSYECHCLQKPIICVPEDSWVIVMKVDNKDSSTTTKVTYSKTVGTEWTTEVTNSFQIAGSVEMALRAGMFFNMAKLTLSGSTGYDWTKVSSEVQSDSVTTAVEIEVPAHSTLTIQTTQGECDGNVVHTEVYKIITEDIDGNIVSETFDPQIFGNTISGQKSYDFELLNKEVGLDKIRSE